MNTLPEATLWPVTGPAAGVAMLLTHWLADDSPRPLQIATSGSTGEPKRVALSRAAVEASVDATHAFLGGPGQWLLTLPPTYVAGLQVIARSLSAGERPVIADAHPDLASAVGAMTGERRYGSLVPTQLVRALEVPADRQALASLDAVLLGGAALDAEVRRRAEEAGIRVITTYGMSETAGGCVYDGRPLPGVAVRIDADGRVWLCGPMLADGYVDDPERTAEAFVDGWFRTDDLGELTTDEHGPLLRLVGRADDMINSGGVKVAASAVAARLRAHPRVGAAEVVGVPDPEWGERVVAHVVGDLDLDEARDWVAAAHPRSWAPRTLRRHAALPLLPNGKVDRLRLRADS